MKTDVWKNFVKPYLNNQQTSHGLWNFLQKTVSRDPVELENNEELVFPKDWELPEGEVEDSQPEVTFPGEHVYPHRTAPVYGYRSPNYFYTPGEPY